MRRLPLWMGALSTLCLVTCVAIVAHASMQQSSPPAVAVRLAQAGTQPPAPPQTSSKPQGTQAQAQYVGEETCLGCHAEMTRGYHGSAHSRKADPRTPSATRGCESCHGPGSAHIDDPQAHGMLAFKRADPELVSDQCLTCHRRGEHAMWEGSAHDARNLSCVTCHSVHDPKSSDDRNRSLTRNNAATGEAAASGGASSARIGSPQLTAASEMELCGRCHRDKVAKIDRSGHMPLREGKMQCSSCHNPHGSNNVRLLRKGDSVGDMCTSCHADKRGPFLWEHAPARDGCATCHDPHGSSNERMLITKPPILCQRCHVATRHPSTIYDGALIGSGATPSVRIFVRSCVACHSTIHGSNHPSGQRFIR